jgi:hypothetical protein
VRELDGVEEVAISRGADPVETRAVGAGA